MGMKFRTQFMAPIPGITSVLVSAALSLLLISLPACRLRAQVSAPIEVVDGKRYYLHQVVKGETPYAIARNYGCDVQVLVASNPGSDAGIREGQMLRLPVDQCRARVTILVAPDASGFINHEVQKRETLFSIARFYNVDPNDIAEANPGADQGVQRGQILRIPVAKPAVPAHAPAPAAESGTMKKHTVIAGETLYAISVQYKVPVDAIMNANPGLTEALRVGQIIQIPQRSMPLEPEPSDRTPLDGSQPFAPLSLIGGLEDSYQIGLALPFLSEPTDTIGLTTREKRLQAVAFQMYRGALLGADTLKAMGFRGDLYSYDVADSKDQAQMLVMKSEMKNMDVLIGPAFRDPLHEVAVWSSTKGPHVVCPVPQANKVLLGSVNMSKAYPSEITMWEGMGTFIASRHKDDRVILCTTNDVEDLKRIQAFRGAYFRERGDSVNEFVIQNRSISGISKMLGSTGVNILVVPSADRLLLTTMFRDLQSSNTIVYGTEEWENNSIIESAMRNKYQIRYPKAVFMDYRNPAVIRFVEAFRKRFRSEPDEYAFLGYSMLVYYGTGLMQFGRAFPNHFGEWTCDACVGAGFNYVRTGEDAGFENRYFAVVGTQEFELYQMNK